MKTIKNGVLPLTLEEMVNLMYGYPMRIIIRNGEEEVNITATTEFSHKKEEIKTTKTININE